MYALKECKDKSGNFKYFTKKHIEDHLKKDCLNHDNACEHHAEDTFTQIRDKQCDLKLVPCPSPVVEKENRFKSMCKSTVVPCKFQIIGCRIAMKREEMVTYER